MPAAYRVTDMTGGHPHCYPPTPAQMGSPTVFTNNLMQMRVGDPCIVHGACCNPCPPHPPMMAKGSGTVFVNGMPACRIGDATNCGDKAAAGSPTVFIGG